MVFDNRGALKRHRSNAHPELEEFKPVDLEPDDPDRAAEMTVACPVCERKFKHKNTCTVHIKTNHLGWSKRKLFECPECQRPFDNKKAVEAHREAVHLGIRTVCPLCEKPVTRLDLHVRMVHTDLPEWPCPGIVIHNYVIMSIYICIYYLQGININGLKQILTAQLHTFH